MGQRIAARLLDERRQSDALIALRFAALTRQTQALGEEFINRMQEEAEQIIAGLMAREQASIANVRELIVSLLEGAELELQKRALARIHDVLRTAPLQALVEEAMAMVADAAGDRVEPVTLRLPVDWPAGGVAAQLAQLCELWPMMRLERTQERWPQVMLAVENGGAVVDPVTFGEPAALDPTRVGAV